MEEKVVEQKTAVAELRHARISARKVKIVIDLIRGKSAKEANPREVCCHMAQEPGRSFTCGYSPREHHT